MIHYSRSLTSATYSSSLVIQVIQCFLFCHIQIHIHANLYIYSTSICCVWSSPSIQCTVYMWSVIIPHQVDALLAVLMCKSNFIGRAWVTPTRVCSMLNFVCMVCTYVGLYIITISAGHSYCAPLLPPHSPVFSILFCLLSIGCPTLRPRLINVDRCWGKEGLQIALGQTNHSIAPPMFIATCTSLILAPGLVPRPSVGGSGNETNFPQNALHSLM